MIEKIEINLIPAEYAIRNRIISINFSTVASFLLSTILILSVLLWSTNLSSDIMREKEKIASIEREIEVNRTIQHEIRTLEAKRSEMQAKVTGLKAVEINRAKWINTLELYSYILPENTWFTSIEESQDGVTININGMTEADAEVGQIMRRLSDSPLVGTVTLMDMRDAGRSGQLKSFNLQHTLFSGRR